jgi:hypothetical protein
MNTSMSDSNTLNQAVGGILLERVINEVVEETGQLKHKTEGLMSMIDHLNTIKLRFGIELHQSFDETMKEEDISTTFDSATVENSVVRIPLAGCNPIPLRKMRSGMLIISNQVSENFHHNCTDLVVFASNVDNEPFIQLALYKFCGIVLNGQVVGLNEDDKLKILNNNEHENRALFLRFLERGQCLNSPDAVFFPRTLTIPLSPRLEDRLKLIAAATNEAVHPSNDSRYSLVDGIGRDADMKLLQENSSLKFKADAFPKIQELIGRVEIDQEDHYGEERSSTYHLASGKFVSEYSNGHWTDPKRNPAWVLSVSNVNYISARPKVYLGGIKIEWLGHLRNNDSYLFTTQNQDEIVGHGNIIGHFRFDVTELVFWLGGIKETLDLLSINFNE